MLFRSANNIFKSFDKASSPRGIAIGLTNIINSIISGNCAINCCLGVGIYGTSSNILVSNNNIKVSKGYQALDVSSGTATNLSITGNIFYGTAATMNAPLVYINDSSCVRSLVSNNVFCSEHTVTSIYRLLRADIDSACNIMSNIFYAIGGFQIGRASCRERV